ncbi:MAG: hypothetical protein R3B06_08805 [Kofleriaceae bacterium]
MGTGVSETSLGPVVQTFFVGLRGRWLALQFAVLAVATSALAMGGLAWWLMDAPPPRAVMVARLMVGGGLGLLLVGAVLVPRVARARGAGVALRIHVGGVVRVRDHLREATRWQDITGVREQLPYAEQTGFATRRYLWVGRVDTAAGSFDLPAQAGHATCALIEAQARPFVWQRMLAAFDRGDPFSFGAVLASPAGLQIGAERLAWPNVQFVTDDEAPSLLRVHTDVGGTRVKRFEVVFPSVLAELCEQVWANGNTVAGIARTLPAAPLPLPGGAALPTARALP